MKRAGRGIGARARRNVFPVNPAAYLTTSLSAYTAAAGGDWVQITGTEYAAMAADTRVGKYGQSDANLGTYSSYGANYTIMGNESPVPANRYPFACALHQVDAASQTVRPKIEGASPTGLVSLGSITTPATAGVLYFVWKNYSVKTVQTSYVASWQSSKTSLGGGSGVSVKVAFNEVGSVIGTGNTNGYSLNMQLLASL
ncbi:hypothetical protein [Arsenicibacter rosenii]|uniref:Uncharacterized protein n=1 Tax=Arsenicibacter rosenii TaxID=1750698 RepID=A0A1S2VAY3_9BACT|nr:hypothetical protein [Arsenicibacter rosenii]OIN55884.1 hypothetical protein BLX24_27910 [Arsenicibacter rosenii]